MTSRNKSGRHTALQDTSPARGGAGLLSQLDLGLGGPGSQRRGQDRLDESH
jgi:hypothetical protein